MKRLIFCLFFMISALGCLQSQTLIGKVIDSKTKLPISQVSVYLNGTSVRTMTDEDGMFALGVEKIINTDLIISHVAYNMISIPNPYAEIPDIIYLSERTNALDEVIVVADRFSRKQKLKLFRKHFLGMTNAGKSCKILNEDDIYLYYNSNNNKLTASSDSPLVIRNKYLGYEVQFTLIDFYIQYSSPPFENLHANELTVKTLTSGDVFSGFFDKDAASFDEEVAFIRGTTSFVDLEPDSKKIEKRRKNVYKHSSGAFFKNLADYSLTESDYKIFNKGFQVNPDNYFFAKDTVSMKKIFLLRNTDINRELEVDMSEPVKGIIDILYEKNKRSKVVFLTDSFLIDQYGNTNAIDKLWFSGNMGNQRAGDMLPLEYEPKE